MGKTCLAVDIGASSGRLILGILSEDRIRIKEIYRFKNQMYKENNSYLWDVDHLFSEILTGLKKFGCLKLEAESIGVDTWAVDYVLLDKNGKKLGPVYAYRDNRTDNTMNEIIKSYSKEKIYEKTGIQFLQFNTIYQLYEHLKLNKNIRDEVSSILMIPDYLNYLLSNKAANEYTNATTTQMYNINQNLWDKELLHLVGLKSFYFPIMIQPGTILGYLSKEIENEVGINKLKVIVPATHDTGSAVVSVPATDNQFAYISSGTWSLMGIENDTPICSKEAMVCNFTNEGGAYNKIRVLKNVMGLWLIQEVKRLLKYAYSFSELASLAEKAKIISLINPNNSRFLNPVNMIEEIKTYCRETNQTIPTTPGELARCIFESLALQYKQVLIQLRKISGRTINKVHIVGGGSQNDYLNQLCADYTECDVFAGPIEATAIGNIMVQYITLGEIDNLTEARKLINCSFNIKKFSPDLQKNVEDKWNEFQKLL
ncbi:rhamnulokinase [Vallitalea sediminicola]